MVGLGQTNHIATSESSWIAEHVHPITLDAPNLNQFDFLKEEIGDKRIVAIGEQMHEDGATFALRAKMIEYLISEMDFDVILFEAGMFDLYAANSSTQTSKNIDSLKNGLYGFWKNADQHVELFAFLQEKFDSGSEITFGGFDCKLTSGYGRSNNNYTRLLSKHITRIDKDFADLPTFKDYLQFWMNIEADMNKGGLGSIAFKMDAEEKSTLMRYSQSVQEWLITQNELEWAQMVKTVDESVLLYSDFRLLKVLFNKEWVLSLNNRRDELMAENLSYLLSTKYAGKKVILFGATYHFARNIQTISPSKVKGIALDKSVTAGGLIYPEIQKDMYTIGFTAYEGTYGYIKKGKKANKVKESSERSLSHQLANQNYEAAFVSLENITTNHPFWQNNAVIRFLDYQTDTSSPDWSAVMDAVVFIKTMTPVTY